MAPPRFAQRPHAGLARDEAEGIGIGETADVLKIARVEFRVRLHQRLEQHFGIHEMHQRAVLRRRIGGIIEGDDAAGAGHGLQHQGWLARYVLAHVPGGELSVKAIGATHPGPDQHLDILALIESFGRLCRRAGRRQNRQNGCP